MSECDSDADVLGELWSKHKESDGDPQLDQELHKVHDSLRDEIHNARQVVNDLYSSLMPELAEHLPPSHRSEAAKSATKPVKSQLSPHLGGGMVSRPPTGKQAVNVGGGANADQQQISPLSPMRPREGSAKGKPMFRYNLHSASSTRRAKPCATNPNVLSPDAHTRISTCRPQSGQPTCNLREEPSHSNDINDDAESPMFESLEHVRERLLNEELDRWQEKAATDRKSFQSLFVWAKHSLEDARNSSEATASLLQPSGASSERQKAVKKPSRATTAVACLVLDTLMERLCPDTELWAALRHEIFSSVFSNYSDNSLFSLPSREAPVALAASSRGFATPRWLSKAICYDRRAGRETHTLL